MLYKSTDYPSIPRGCIYLANLDVLSDMIPVVSSVTNIARVFFKITTFVMATCIAGMYCFYKSIVNFTMLMSSQHSGEFLKTVFKVQSLVFKNFFLSHYFSKSINDSLIHCVPFVGNFCAYKNASMKDPENLKNQWVAKVQKWALPGWSKYYSFILPPPFQQDKELIIANFQMNPFHGIPNEVFKNTQFIEELLQAFTFSNWNLSRLIEADQRRIIMEEIIKTSHRKGFLQEVKLPPEINMDIDSLCVKYPFILWMMGDIEFFQKKSKELNEVLVKYPQLITILQKRFLEKNKKVFLSALKLKPKLAGFFENEVLVSAFDLKKSSLKDDAFNLIAKAKPSFEHIFKDMLRKKLCEQQFVRS